MLKRHKQSHHQPESHNTEVTIPPQDDEGDNVNMNMRERFNCDACGFKTTSDYVLSKHKQVVHETKVKASVSKRKSCDECGKKFNKMSTFSTHMRKIHGVIMDQLHQENTQVIIN